MKEMRWIYTQEFRKQVVKLCWLGNQRNGPAVVVASRKFENWLYAARVGKNQGS